ncbi:MAG: glycosyltransferase, partial [bacterium]
IQAYIQKSSVVLARSGYSTLMDLATIGKKAILVPTPGQTEQIYLAAYLSEKNIFYSIAQDNFNLDEALYLVKNTTGIFQPSSKMDLERIILGDLL